MYKTLPIKLYLSLEQESYWREQCEHSNNLFNCALYEAKQVYFYKLHKDNAYSTYWRNDEYKTSWKLRIVLGVSYPTLDKMLKNNNHYKALPAQASQQVLKSVDYSLKSFNQLVEAFFRGEVDKPLLPSYRKSGGLNAVCFPTTNLKISDGKVRLSATSEAKKEMLCDTVIDIPSFVIPEQIKLIRIRPSRGSWWVDFVIDDNKQPIENNQSLDYENALAIDHGVKFWLSVVSTKKCRSFIVEAPQLKTTLWKYQAKVKQHKTGKPQKYWDD